MNSESTVGVIQGLTILPDSRARITKGVVHTPYGWDVPIYCASCGAHGGTCPQETPFLFYLCPSCFQSHGEQTLFAFMPDEVFFRQVEEAQVEKYGHALDAVETEIQLGDPESLESRLARDRTLLTPKAGA